jgi:hypothetical protein
MHTFWVYAHRLQTFLGACTFFSDIENPTFFAELYVQAPFEFLLV